MPEKESYDRVTDHAIPRARAVIENYAAEKGVPQWEVNHLVGATEAETLANIEADRRI